MMKYSILLATAFMIWSCASEQDRGKAKAVTIRADISQPVDSTIELVKVAPIGDDIEVATARPDDNGVFIFTIKVTQPGHYRLRDGRNSIELYLHPGDDLKVTAHSDDVAGTVLFDGAGAEVNNYIAGKFRKEQEYKRSLSNQNLFQMEEEEFLEAMSGLRTMHEEFYNSRFADGVPSKEFETFAKAEIISGWAAPLSTYPTYHGYWTGKEDFEPSEGYFSYRDDITYKDSSALVSPQYRSYLYAYGANTFNDLVDSDTTLQGDWPKAYTILYNRLKTDEALGPRTRDYLLAVQAYDFVNYFGADAGEPIVEDYRQRSLNDAYLEAVNATYEKWQRLSRGEDAPNFEYEAEGGEVVALDDFKGRVVYVDIWATWCTPCKREIPASKALKEKFASEDVVFMYVSVDENEGAWRKYLANDPDFKGVHLITGEGWQSDITREYMIKGIPRYLLIDRNGKIVNASAPRPSSGEKIESLIREALEA